MAAPGQQSGGDTLIHQIVLDDQDAPADVRDLARGARARRTDGTGGRDQTGRGCRRARRCDTAARPNRSRALPLDRKVESCGEVKCTASTGLALDPDAAAHHVHKGRGNRQAETRAAEPACGGSVGLVERFEDAGVLIVRDRDPRVTDAEV